MKKLKTLHLEKTGKVSDKWSSYLDFYDRLFSPIRLQDIRLLEIGVQNGGSLETWSSYFPNAQCLVGCDIDPKCGALRYDDPRVHVVIGDANSEPAYKNIINISEQFDVIIDDGSHISRDIFYSFINYFPLLRPGSFYVIEDSHTLYMSQYGGGILNQLSAQKFFYKLAELLSYEFWSDSVALDAFFSDFFLSGQLPSFLAEGWVESVQFRNSMIIIEKAITPSHSKLGDRLVTGSQAIVQRAVVDEALDSRRF